MTENEKLRALLAEARAALSQGCWTGECCAIRQRIDAALAEPVDDYDIDADLRLHKEDRLRLRAENLRLERERDGNAYLLAEVTRERDEARAEVERWKESYRLLYEVDGTAEAFKRGAEAMREAAAGVAHNWADPRGPSDSAEIRGSMIIAARIETIIRALPVPEDKP